MASLEQVHGNTNERSTNCNGEISMEPRKWGNKWVKADEVILGRGLPVE